MDKILTNVAGTFLIQADASFLNGAGLGEGEDRNVTIPKTFQDGKDKVPYVSSQAWKRWLRNTCLDENPNWPKSELKAIHVNEKGNTDKIAGALNPIDFPEDDIFGYMKTAKNQGRESAESDEEEKSDEEKEREKQTKFCKDVKSDITAIQKGEKGKSKNKKILTDEDKVKLAKETIKKIKDELNARITADEESFDNDFQQEVNSLQVINNLSEINKDWFSKINGILKEFDPGRIKALMRSSPFAASLLVSIRKSGWRGRDEGFVHLKEGTPQPYTTEFYNAHLQGVFSLCYSRLGVFSNLGDRIELNNGKKEEFIKKNKIKVIDDKGELGQVYEMVPNPRKDRASALLKALSVLRGGAKQAQFGTDVSPKVLILAGLNCGNPIFNHIFNDAKEGPEIKIDTLKEIIKDYADRLVTPVYLGIRKGYLNSKNETDVLALNNTEIKEVKIMVTTPIEATQRMAGELK